MHDFYTLKYKIFITFFCRHFNYLSKNYTVSIIHRYVNFFNLFCLIFWLFFNFSCNVFTYYNSVLRFFLSFYKKSVCFLLFLCKFYMFFDTQETNMDNSILLRDLRFSKEKYSTFSIFMHINIQSV